MLNYLARRAVYMLIMLWILTMVIFFIIQLPAGDYVTTLAAQLAQRGEEVNEELLSNLRRRYGLDQPLYAQYLKWLDGHPMGTMVVVGNPTFEYRNHEAGMTNIDIRRASRVGPGYHDDAWERGADYPPVFMRWTARTNLELTVRLIGEAEAAGKRPDHAHHPHGSCRAGYSGTVGRPRPGPGRRLHE